jgi:hypothetical protein
VTSGTGTARTSGLRRCAAIGSALGIALAVSACGSSSTGGPTAGSPAAGGSPMGGSTASSPPVGGPAGPSPSAPLAFDEGTPVGALPAPPGNVGRRSQRVPAVLDRTTAYLADPAQVRVVDTTDGREVATIRPQHPVLVTGGGAGDQGHPPVLTTVHGTRSVVWPFLVRTPGGPAIELAGIDTATHAATDVLVGLPGWAAGAAFNLSVTPAGAAGDTVALNVAGGLYHALLTVDAGTGALRWTRDDFTSGAVSGTTVVGTAPDTAAPDTAAPDTAAGGAPANTEHVVGLALADGKQLWTQLHGYGLTVLPAGPDLVAVSGRLPTGVATGTFALLSSTTGATAANLAVSDGLPSSCLYDQVSVVVCEAPTDNEIGSRIAVGVDARTGRPLWSMPDTDTGTEPVPLFTAGWHGVFYAVGPDGDTVAYRGDTGSPLHSSPGPAPALVNDRAGLAVTADGSHLITCTPTDQGLRNP